MLLTPGLVNVKCYPYLYLVAGLFSCLILSEPPDWLLPTPWVPRGRRARLPDHQAPLPGYSFAPGRSWDLVFRIHDSTALELWPTFVLLWSTTPYLLALLSGCAFGRWSAFFSFSISAGTSFISSSNTSVLAFKQFVTGDPWLQRLAKFWRVLFAGLSEFRLKMVGGCQRNVIL